MDKPGINPSAFIVFPALETPRLFLRAIHDNDVFDFLPICTFDGKLAGSAKEALKMLDKMEAEYRQKNSISWGLALKENNRIIGSCGYYRGFAQNCGEIGYIIRQEYRRKGYMAEAVEAIVKYGFSGLNLDRVKAYTKSDNLASANLLRKLQFTELLSETPGTLKFICDKPRAI